MRIAYFDCFSGVSGDMCLGALVSAGWPARELEALPARLGLEGVAIRVGAAKRGPFVATRVEVDVAGRQPHRHLHHIAAMIERADLDATVKARAVDVFTRLADAEAEVHGSTRDKVHFHEVGAADALVDVVGAIEGLRALGVDEVAASPLRLGRGAVMSEHGLIPVPAPATTLLLRGVPVEMPDIEAELVTPTGAALLTTLVRDWSSPPAFTLETIGTGAGGRDLKEQPNVLRVLIGESRPAGLARRRIVVLETALDDDNPQFVAALLPRLLEHGALDAMVVPSVMKKGRPGMWLIVLAEPDACDALARMLLRETSALGVRVRSEERYELERRPVEVETRFGRIALKVATVPGEGERAVPEFESVRAAAERSGRPLREVSEAALAAWRGQSD
ncbi:MAG: nickel pincer cofactor biosynthesis protein LarC [Candidatus Eisenbacteria bacterium]|uniref:Putative nickel insertion protein n=1 Tax=Eiseniibacteriota bacterium TaxID=2212470 RepID=A0A9D6LB75_UNCEI|nr:nickel pincer cofactor biosynthesis protein LarC [Candidatus Eisenbacteria bacterium]MBI3539973.1 nickel pincer cofactor biosynthesis protein LarC [Candidatus Eisenbacteria bacterium]